MHPPCIRESKLPEDHQMHIDCDLYNTSRTIFTETAQLSVPGTIIVFDELFNYPRWEKSECRALTEFAADTGMQFDYIGYVPTGLSGGHPHHSCPGQIDRGSASSALPAQ